MAGSVYATKHQAPIVLTDSSLPERTMNYLKSGKTSAAVIFGGKNVVGPDIEQVLRELVKGQN